MNCTKCNTPVENERWKQCESCREYTRRKMVEYRKRHPTAEYQRDWNRRQRENVIAHYGGCCVCCGETEFEFLAVDHTEGGGNKHRAEVKKRGTNMIRWLINNGYPEGFRVLCHNCNQAIGFYGQCPHERRKLTLIEGGEEA